MRLLDAILKAKRVFLCGNGGSAANAIHIANDLISVGVKAQALTADIATLTAIANDYAYEEVFSRQLFVLAEKGDLLIVLSGSGNSKNILFALAAAEKLQMDSFAIIGNYGAKSGAEEMANDCLKMGRNMQEAEEQQVYLGHAAMRKIKERGIDTYDLVAGQKKSA